MILLQETTEWRVPTPNHIYIFETAYNCVGYIKQGETKAIKFTEPRKIDKRRRTFEKIKPKGFDLSAFTWLKITSGQVVSYNYNILIHQTGNHG